MRQRTVITHTHLVALVLETQRSNSFQNLENHQNVKISSTALSFSEMLIKTCSYLFAILSRLRKQLPVEGNAWTIWFMHLQHIRSLWGRSPKVIIRIADSGVPWLSSNTSFRAEFIDLVLEQVKFVPGKSPQLRHHIWKKRQSKKYLARSEWVSWRKCSRVGCREPAWIYFGPKW